MSATTVAFSPKLIAEKGEQIYSDRYKAEFEKKYPGRFVAIEINPGEAFLADSAEEAISKVEKKCNGSLPSDQDRSSRRLTE